MNERLACPQGEGDNHLDFPSTRQMSSAVLSAARLSALSTTTP